MIITDISTNSPLQNSTILQRSYENYILHFQHFTFTRSSTFTLSLTGAFTTFVFIFWLFVTPADYRQYGIRILVKRSGSRDWSRSFLAQLETDWFFSPLDFIHIVSDGLAGRSLTGATFVYTKVSWESFITFRFLNNQSTTPHTIRAAVRHVTVSH